MDLLVVPPLTDSTTEVVPPAGMELSTSTSSW
ncbi:hypothetical protein EDD27_4801 [Nonomuraea polychroma]|uniref:Uncharacterized protein n=1 Tax=Nonomuraea polychroma TaxID=46176 RepID=A0A438M8Z3_9ACTN|nr:hypothetical protein EDD27_4801 [Nonomuraea polychroma]